MEEDKLLQAISEMMDQKLETALQPIKEDIGALKQGQAKLEQGYVKLEQGQAKLEQSYVKLEQSYVKLEQGQTKLEQGQTKLEQEIAKINIKLETDIEKKLDLLFEGQRGMNEKFAQLDRVTEDVEQIKVTVNALEAMTKANVTDIKALKLIK